MPSRSIWKGAITFGLITIPVGLYTAIEEKDFRFNQLHGKDNGRIKYKRTCSVCGEEVPYDEIVKGYEFEKGNYVVFTEEEMDAIPADSIKAIDVVSFVPLEEIDPVYFQKPYYVAPEPSGVKAYKLLEKAMNDSGRIGIAKITLREKERLATLRVKDGVFILETMNWPDEIREPDFAELQKDVEIRPQELAMAKSLIENLSDTFQPDEFRDTYRERLEAAVQAKIEGQEVAVEATKEPTQILDLMEALKASVEATKAKAKAGEKDSADKGEKAQAKKSA
ncbi:MAG TPA: Ku protein [Actinomycetota bacterium]|nr:Ku protein [Actinomycetota bacterium]